MTNNKTFGTGFDQLSDTSHINRITLFNMDSNEIFSVDNLSGKQASVKILYSISQQSNSSITAQEAHTGIDLFGDYALDEQQHPNSHPNIRFLMNVIENNQHWKISCE